MAAGTHIPWDARQVLEPQGHGPCSILPEEPLEPGCQDQWSRCGSRMINTFNYALRWGCHCHAQPSGLSGLAQLACSQLPQGSAGLGMLWGRQPRGTHTARPHQCLPRGRDHTQQHPRVWRSSGRLAGEATPPPSPWRPAPHPPASMSPWLPRGLASLAEGGAAAGGSCCHLHLAALGTGGSSSSALPPGHGEPARAGGRRLGSGWR